MTRRTQKKAPRQVDDPPCPGTLIEHADGTLECTESPDCEATEDLHAHTESCEVLTPECRCVRRS